MKRRRLLALCGSLLATAGCVSTPAEPRDETGTETPVPPPDSPTDEGTGTRTDFGTVSVESATVQQGVVGSDSPDSIGVYDEAEQYLVVIVAVDGPAPEPERFALKADGHAVNPDTLVDGLYRDGQWAVRYGQGGGPLVFPLPATVPAESVRLEWPGGSWSPPEPIRHRLAARPPGFAVSMDGPSQVEPDDDPKVSVVVTNVGEVAGRFVLALNRSGPRVAYTPVARLTGVLDPGESWQRTFDAESPYIADPPRRATYLLDAPGGRQDTTVTLSPADASTESASETGTVVE